MLTYLSCFSDACLSARLVSQWVYQNHG